MCRGVAMNDDDIFLLKVHSINQRQYGKRSLNAACKHNKRTLMHSDSDPIDSTRSHRNLSLLDTPGTPEGVVELADRLIAERGFRPKRADASIVVEGVFSLREELKTFDMVTYFSEAARWLVNHFDGQLLSADVHMDQSHPHCHVLVLLPLVDGGPSGSSVIGFKQQSHKRCLAFFEQVASKYDLRMPPPPLSAEDKRLQARRVHEHLHATGDPAIHSALWSRFSNGINRDPRGYGADLGLPTKPVPTLAQLAQLAGRGPRTAAEEKAGNRRMQSAWTAQAAAREVVAVPTSTTKGVASFSSRHPGGGNFGPEDEHPSCVAVASFSSTNPASAASPPPLSVCPEPPVFTRTRDADLDPADFDPDRGEHIAPQNQTQSRRAAAKGAGDRRGCVDQDALAVDDAGRLCDRVPGDLLAGAIVTALDEICAHVYCSRS